MSVPKKQRIVMILENGGYPEDTRVYLEARALTEAGHRVSVVCRDGWNHKKSHEVLDGVRVYRYPAPPDRASLGGYLWEYGYSFSMALAISFYILVRHGFDVVHIHMPPDLNGMLGVLYQLFGRRFVMDHHDLSPELYRAQNRKNGFLYRMLLFFERISCRRADRLIATNATQRRIQIERGGARQEHCFIVRNGPAEFFLQECEPVVHAQKGQRTVIGFVGEMGEQDGVPALIRAFHLLKTELNRPDFLGVLVGTGRCHADIKNLVDELDLSDQVIFTGSIPFHLVPSYIASFDIGATPDLSNPYTDSCTTIKTMEYMAMGKPTVSFMTTENRVTAQDSALYAENNDERAFAAALAKLMDDPELRTRLGQIGRQRIIHSLAWKHQSQQLRHVYESF
jgi:glycosyltransferase involved in cell wall biosynthesis